MARLPAVLISDFAWAKSGLERGQGSEILMHRFGWRSNGELRRAPSPRPSPIRWEREAIGRVRASFGGPVRFHGAGFLRLSALQSDCCKTACVPGGVEPMLGQ